MKYSLFEVRRAVEDLESAAIYVEQTAGDESPFSIPIAVARAVSAVEANDRVAELRTHIALDCLIRYLAMRDKSSDDRWHRLVKEAAQAIADEVCEQ